MAPNPIKNSLERRAKTKDNTKKKTAKAKLDQKTGFISLAISKKSFFLSAQIKNPIAKSIKTEMGINISTKFSQTNGKSSLPKRKGKPPCLSTNNFKP